MKTLSWRLPLQIIGTMARVLYTRIRHLDRGPPLFLASVKRRPQRGEKLGHEVAGNNFKDAF